MIPAKLCEMRFNKPYFYFSNLSRSLISNRKQPYYLIFKTLNQYEFRIQVNKDTPTPKELNVNDPQCSLRNWGEMDIRRKQPGTG